MTMNKQILKAAFTNAIFTSAYIFAISFFLFNIQHIFDTAKPDTVFVPILMLSLLVFSVAMVGSLIFGQPILWYWDGRKNDSIYLLISTLAFFFAVTLIVFLLAMSL